MKLSDLQKHKAIMNMNCMKANQSYRAIAPNTVENNVTHPLAWNNPGATLLTPQQLISLTKQLIMKLAIAKSSKSEIGSLAFQA